METINLIGLTVAMFIALCLTPSTTLYSQAEGLIHTVTTPTTKEYVNPRSCVKWIFLDGEFRPKRTRTGDLVYSPSCP